MSRPLARPWGWAYTSGLRLLRLLRWQRDILGIRLLREHLLRRGLYMHRGWWGRMCRLRGSLANAPTEGRLGLLERSHCHCLLLLLLVLLRGGDGGRTSWRVETRRCSSRCICSTA